MNKLGEAQRFIVEDLAVYTGGLLMTVFYDNFVNLAINLGLRNDPQPHPYVFGITQMLLTGFCIVQISRKLREYLVLFNDFNLVEKRLNLKIVNEDRRYA